MRYLGIVVVLFGTCLLTIAQKSDAGREVIGMENHFNDVLLRSDWKGVEQIEGDDLVFTNADGSVTHKPEQVGSVKSGDLKFQSIDMSEVQVLDFGRVAVASGKLIEKVQYKTSDLSGTYRFTDVWVKRNGKWQLVAGQETRSK
jgi:hypothetical protein